MSPADLDSLLAQLASTLRGLGVPVSKKLSPHVAVNSRAKRRLGCCSFTPSGCVIEVSDRLLDREDLLRLTLVHELLHTCPGCRNHGEKWKAWARLAGEALGMDIRRTVDLGEQDSAPLRQEAVKYVLVCQSCGARIRRKRMSKAVKYPWRYRCPCGGKLRRETVGEGEAEGRG